MQKNNNSHVAQPLLQGGVSGSVLLKCWIVRNSASCIQFGGLQRLFVHFAKPRFNYRKARMETGDNPFCESTEKCGLYVEAGWEHTAKMWVAPLSVGNWIGYDNEISTFIWEKLCEHFKNEPFENWEQLERNGEVNQEDFCLEVEMSVSLN